MLTPRFSSKRKTEEHNAKAANRSPKHVNSGSQIPRSNTHGSIVPPTPSCNQSLPWKEEEEEDAVYVVYLKKVRYRSSVTALTRQEDISYMLWETVKTRTLKAGTLTKLIEHLTPPLQSAVEEDPGFFMVFLCTFRAFATTDEVLDLLLERYRMFKNKTCETEKEQDNFDFVLRRICSVLSCWLEQYSGDFDQPPSYTALHKVIDFGKNEVSGIPWKDMLGRAEAKLQTLSVTPYEAHEPYRFKLCVCDSVLDCSCGRYDKLARENKATFTTFSSSEVAEQLTMVDAELFRRAVPRHCLGCFWSKRDEAPTIKATIDFFNGVVNRVTATVLLASGHRAKDPQARAKVIKKWIEVAEECRGLKNFSSLKAIISGLQGVAVHRLRRSWALLSREMQAMFDEMSGIFSDDLNQKASRDLLMQEGTAKYASVDGRTSKRTHKKRQSWMKEGVIQGTVPYLGTFLTDLMMIDTAHTNFVKGGLINFEKRKKEFEVIAQIKMLQESAKNYSFSPNEKFHGWFYSVKTLTDDQSFQLSKELEPDRACTPQPPRRVELLKRHLSETDLSKTLSNDRASVKVEEKERSSTINHPKLIHSASSPERPSTPVNLTSSPMVGRQILDPQGQIARVCLEGSARTDVYKSIVLTSNDRTKQVIKTALEKYDINEPVESYELYQIIPGAKDLLLPPTSNVLYAINKSCDPMFKLSRKNQLTDAEKTKPLIGLRTKLLGPASHQNGHVTKERRVGVIRVRAPCPLGHEKCQLTCIDTRL